jgi:hypothetical protein
VQHNVDVGAVPDSVYQAAVSAAPAEQQRALHATSLPAACQDACLERALQVTQRDPPPPSSHIHTLTAPPASRSSPAGSPATELGMRLTGCNAIPRHPTPPHRTPSHLPRTPRHPPPPPPALWQGLLADVGAAYSPAEQPFRGSISSEAGQAGQLDLSDPSARLWAAELAAAAELATPAATGGSEQ